MAKLASVRSRAGTGRSGILPVDCAINLGVSGCFNMPNVSNIYIYTHVYIYNIYICTHTRVYVYIYKYFIFYTHTVYTDIHAYTYTHFKKMLC